MPEAPREEEQVTLRADLVELHPVLTARAAVLSRGLRPPRPDPEELVSTVATRLLRKYRDGDIRTTTRQLAFTTLARVVCDIARRRREELLEDDGAVVDDRPAAGPHPELHAAIQKLPTRERALVEKVLEGVAVPDAFVAIDWKVRSPYPEYRKVVKMLRAYLVETSCR